MQAFKLGLQPASTSLFSCSSKVEEMRSSETSGSFSQLHGVTTKKAVIFIVTTVITSNPANILSGSASIQYHAN
jgi:hypothetical protein